MQMRGDGPDGGQYLRIKEGTSAFSEGLAAKLKPDTIRIQSPVSSIEPHRSGLVTVTTGESSPKTYQARKVIVSIPTPLYKHVKFSPALPSLKTAVVDRTKYGFYTKYNISFHEAFWARNGFCGLAQSFNGPASVFRDTSTAISPAMTCFLGGSFGRKWAMQDEEGKKSSILKQISNIFADSQDISHLVVETFESPWMSEEFSGWGCPCAHLPPGILADGWDAMCAPAGNIHFVGTELSKVWRGYMEGAVRSGEEGAQKVMAELKQLDLPHSKL
jgi:monoamine oxidase